MIGAFRVKCRTAVRAMIIAIQIFTDGHFIFTNAAKNGLGVKFFFFPSYCRMTRFFRMTVITGIISIAAFKFNGNNIQRRVIMNAAGLVVCCFAFYSH